MKTLLEAAATSTLVQFSSFQFKSVRSIQINSVHRNWVLNSVYRERRTFIGGAVLPGSPRQQLSQKPQNFSGSVQYCCAAASPRLQIPLSKETTLTLWSPSLNFQRNLSSTVSYKGGVRNCSKLCDCSSMSRTGLKESLEPHKLIVSDILVDSNDPTASPCRFKPGHVTFNTIQSCGASWETVTQITSLCLQSGHSFNISYRSKS